jgi:hypothetical protein
MGSGTAIDLEDTRTYVRPELSVYLACSLTSDERRSFKDDVLSSTAKVFADAGFKVHNPALHTAPGSPHSPSEVCFEDLFRTINADFIFFLRLGRSHGMGIEAQLAADVLLPWADARLGDDSYKLSPLLAGLSSAPTEFLAPIAADHPDQFYARLAQHLGDEHRLDRLRAARHIRHSAHALIRDTRFGYHVRVHRLIFGLSTTSLGTLTNIDPTWIDAIESDSRFVAKLTLVQFARLCDALEMTFAPSPGGPPLSLPRVKPPGGVGPALLAAAETFAEYSLGSGCPTTRRRVDDASLLLQWHDWLHSKNLTPLQRCHHQLLPSEEPIRVYLCPPLSNVLPAEKQAVDSLMTGIIKALKGSGIQLEIEVPTMQLAGRQEHGPEIYLNRVARLRNTDLAIPLLDPPSTGVGIMLQLFHNATIPCLCVTKNWAGVSRMVRGLAPAQMCYVEHSSPEAAGSEVAEWLTEHADEIRHSRVHRDQAWERVRGLDIHRTMTLSRIVGAGVSQMPLLREEFLKELAGSRDMIGTLTLLQLAHLANTQQWHLIPSPTGFLALEPPIGTLAPNTRNREMATAAVRASLATFWEALEECGPAISEAEARRAWSSFVAELSLNAARKENRVQTIEDLSRSKKQWLKVLRAQEEL